MEGLSPSDIERSVAGNKNRDKLFAVVGLLSTFVGMLTWPPCSAISYRRLDV
jgi:hypothetical protein